MPRKRRQAWAASEPPHGPRYAFANFVDAVTAQRAFGELQGRSISSAGTAAKPVFVAWARVQGFAANLIRSAEQMAAGRESRRRF